MNIAKHYMRGKKPYRELYPGGPITEATFDLTENVARLRTERGHYVEFEIDEIDKAVKSLRQIKKFALKYAKKKAESDAGRGS